MTKKRKYNEAKRQTTQRNEINRKTNRKKGTQTAKNVQKKNEKTVL